jgi:hypothetical protein
MPARSEWNRGEVVAGVLNIISKENYNHFYSPVAWGDDLTECTLSKEPGCIELFIAGFPSPLIVNTGKLFFESFSDPIWNYFRLETNALDPTGIYKQNDLEEEIVIELQSGEYIPSEHWNTNNSQETANGRLVYRHLKPSANVIFTKNSPYNEEASTYDGRHSKITSDEFRNYIQTLI